MKIVEKNGKQYVLGEIRKKYLVLTPEEKVRQQVILFLIKRGYPRSAISVEKSIALHGKNRRYDIVIYKDSTPWMIVECKSATTKISQDTFDQIGHYNMALKVPYLFITNGEQHYVLEVDGEAKTYEFLEKLPVYPKLMMDEE